MSKLVAFLVGLTLVSMAVAIPARTAGEKNIDDDLQGWGPTGQGVYYLRNASYGYASAWYNSRNPHYNDFTGSGGDCANFVSQCLIAGGMSLWKGTNGGGYGVYPDVDRPTTSSNGTIPFCDYLHQHLTRYQAVDYDYAVEGVNATIPPETEVGDVVIFGTDGGDRYSHAMIVVSVGATDIGLAAHTTDTWGASFWSVLGGSFTCASFYHIKVELSTPFPFMVSTGTLNVRAGPGLNSAGNYYQALGTALQSQMYVSIGTQIDASGNVWYNFWYDDRNAWCAANMVSGNVYCKPVNQPQFEIHVATTLNVRDGAGTSFVIAGQAYDGMRFVPKGMRNNAGTLWRSFWWGGMVKWCSAGYTFNATIIEKNVTRLNVGFWPSWMGTDYRSLQQDKLTHLAWFSVEMNTAGDISNYNSWPSGWSSLVLRCHENGTKVLLTMTLFGSSSVSTFLASSTARANGIANLLAQTVAGNADGIMIDLEYPPSGSDANLLAFMQELHAAFYAENMLYEVHLCLMPYPWASYGFGQLPAINNYVDYYFLMGYDYFYGGSANTGACGALFWGNNVDAWHAIERWITVYGASRNKLIYGIPYFGFDWPVSSGQYNVRGASTTGAGSSRTYNAAMTRLGTYGAALQWDTVSLSPWFWYWNGTSYRQVWFDNATSLEYKYQVVNQLDLPGMGIWALAYDDPRTELWGAIDEKVGKFSLDTVPANGSTVSGVVNISSVAWGGVTDVWMKVPGGIWQETTYSTDIHQTYKAKFHKSWDTTSLATGWHDVQFRLNNSFGHISFENRTYYVNNGNASFSIPMVAGWNLVSLPLVTSYPDVASALASISGKWTAVKAYDSTDQADPWTTNRPGSTVNDLDMLERNRGFWIQTTQACTLNITGIVPAATAITLKAGWNLVGYPSLDESKTIATALAGTGYDRVEGFAAASPYIQALASSYVMKPGEGYWVRVPADTIWNVNW
jgi:spore germination protein YaaH